MFEFGGEFLKIAPLDMGEPNDASGLRRLAAGSINYTEMVGPWQVRAGH